METKGTLNFDLGTHGASIVVRQRWTGDIVCIRPDLESAQRAAEQIEATYQVRHGINCEKRSHFRDGYLHGADDDTPYDVDGVKYCGRCHVAL